MRPYVECKPFKYTIDYRFKEIIATNRHHSDVTEADPIINEYSEVTKSGRQFHF